jgi:hypothetical protein
MNDIPASKAERLSFSIDQARILKLPPYKIINL